MKKIIAVLFFIACMFCAGYFGLWMYVINPIIIMCQNIDAQTVTATLIGWTVVKCVCGLVGTSIIIWIGTIISTLIGFKQKKTYRKSVFDTYR